LKLRFFKVKRAGVWPVGLKGVKDLTRVLG